ncbi:MAG: hypothetical protein M1826_003152, partial [Phylliscum demangeonii]
MIFFPRPLHLRITQPSATSIQFTISTWPSHPSLSQRLGWAVLCLARLLLAGLILSLHLSRCRPRPPPPNNNNNSSHNLLLTAAATALPAPLVAAAAAQKWLLPLLTLGAGYLVLMRGYREESLLVLRGLGIQTSSSPSSYLSTWPPSAAASAATTRFIPTSQMQDLFIHEAFVGFEVRFYLALVVRREEQVVVVFP